jgi:putative OPT family oligopeptide transporter
MATTNQTPHVPYVPPGRQMTEFTWRAVLLGLALTIVLGAANAYLGLRAGQTIAATYPAAVIGMAAVRLWRGSILEENIARTAGSIGESVAAGAIFTLPAFYIAKAWPTFAPEDVYWKSTALMVVGGVMGVLFVSLVRRVLVEDRELPFPESVAAAEIHKAGQSGSHGAKFLFWSMGFGGLVYLLGAFRAFVTEREFFFRVGSGTLKLGGNQTVSTGGVTAVGTPAVSPAYLGVGYIIGPALASLNFAGSVLAWGVLVPLLLMVMGPGVAQYAGDPAKPEDWLGIANATWRFIVRPIAVGTMMVGAGYTLFRMRKSLGVGLSKAFGELRGPKVDLNRVERHERYMSQKTVLLMIAGTFLAMMVLYSALAGVVGGVVAAIVMLIVGFFFATVSGYLVGVIGSSNNPISGLTLSTLIIAALLMVSLGIGQEQGVVAVLGVAAVVCVSSAVAGELLQDFKVGYLLGGTPRTIQIVELVAVLVASAVMYFPLLILHEGNIKSGGIGFGDPRLSAPQAGLMASLAQGIVNQDMPWELVIFGMMLGLMLILIQVKSVMLVAIGMYLPIGTTSAIFVGGLIRWLTDSLAQRRGLNHAQRARVENVGILSASGMIAGEALMGLVTAFFAWREIPLPVFFAEPSFLLGLGVMALIALVLIRVPLANAGSPDEPAPPTAMV